MASGQKVTRARPKDRVTAVDWPGGPPAEPNCGAGGGWNVAAWSSSGRPSSSRGVRVTMGAYTVDRGTAPRSAWLRASRTHSD
eukprot:8990717-Alexandrium_andersonii.AAC.1